jgi:transcriptional regulator with XRE-family HTH domain
MPRELTRGQRAAADKARTRAEEKYLSQKDLAQLVGVSEKAVWNFFNGKVWPQGRTLASYERHLGWVSGHLNEVASRYDSDVREISDAEPHEQRILQLVQDLRRELDDQPASQHGATVERELKRLSAQLADLGAGAYRNVRPLKLRSLGEVDAEIAQETGFRNEALESGSPGSRAVAAIIDEKIATLKKERELVLAHGQSSVAES